MNPSLSNQLLELTSAERIQLVEDLWDGIVADPALLPALTSAQHEEIERRLADHACNRRSAMSWEEVRQHLWNRLG